MGQTSFSLIGSHRPRMRFTRPLRAGLSAASLSTDFHEKSTQEAALPLGNRDPQPPGPAIGSAKAKLKFIPCESRRQYSSSLSPGLCCGSDEPLAAPAERKADWSGLSIENRYSTEDGGDKLLLFTDGLLEARLGDRMLGKEGIADAFLGLKEERRSNSP